MLVTTWSFALKILWIHGKLPRPFLDKVYAQLTASPFQFVMNQSPQIIIHPWQQDGRFHKAALCVLRTAVKQLQAEMNRQRSIDFFQSHRRLVLQVDLCVDRINRILAHTDAAAFCRSINIQPAGRLRKGTVLEIATSNHPYEHKWHAETENNVRAALDALLIAEKRLLSIETIDGARAA